MSVHEMSAYADSDGATCLDSRRSVSGGEHSTGWGARSPGSQGRAQVVVLSSSSEAEYFALAEIVKEVLRLRQVQPCITPNVVDVSIKSFEDN